MIHRMRIVASLAVIVLVASALAVAGCGALGVGPQGPGTPLGPTPAPAPADGKMAAGSARLVDVDNRTTVELAVGGTLTVDLEENATTGFSWSVETTPAMLKATGDEQVAAADTGVVGAAGRHIFTWEATAAGTGELRLQYARPWESVQPAKVFSVTVVVK
jgi:inhibitor of cysteine peptidase